MTMLVNIGEIPVRAKSHPTLSQIANLSLTPAQTHDMNQYINDPSNVVTNSQILGINPAVATYSHATRLLTAVADGTINNCRLEVTYSV